MASSPDGQHWMSDPSRLPSPRPGLDRDTTLVVNEMTRRNNVQDRAYRAGLWRRPWADGDWHPSCRGKPWPAYAAEPYQWGLEAAEQADREAMADRARRVAEQQLRVQHAARARTRARRARRAWKIGRLVAPNLTRRWRRIWLGR